MILKQNKKTFYILEDNGDVSHTFFIKDNLDEALKLLKKINALKINDNEYLYETVCYKGYSLWSFYQHYFFWNRLRYFEHIRDIIEYLQRNNITEITTEGLNINYVIFLESAGIRVHRYSDISQLKKIIIFLFEKIILFLVYIISNMTFLSIRLLKIKYIIYTPDIISHRENCDFRFFEVYKFFSRRELKFIEIFHTRFGIIFLKNFFKRKRLALYLEVYPLFFKNKRKVYTPKIKGLLEIEEIAFRVLYKDFITTVDSRIKRINLLIKQLSKTNLKKLISMDDVRNTNELIVACKEVGIKTIGIQHGHFTKYLVGSMNYNIPKEKSVTFDNLYLWNRYWSNLLHKYSNQYDTTNTKIGGLLRPFAKYNLKNISLPKKIDQLKLLVLSEPWAPKDEVGSFINELIKRNVSVYLSIRPDASNEVLEEYNIQNIESVKIVNKVDEKILNEIHAACGTYSTYLHELLYFNKPILLMETSFKHGHVLIDDDLAFLLKKDNFNKIIPYIKKWKEKKSIVWPDESVSLYKTLMRETTIQ